eukprot:TRINITY_DN24866_c0_g1_i1.p1 TRINITY_DN24866_c0_g1~~TRINITY_DN24866_c0_g1_i1.p1  ORF type:complete len:690 (+),score=123.58 TRINITY_DN24866_c0_g1_i1:148-2217(+)
MAEKTTVTRTPVHLLPASPHRHADRGVTGAAMPAGGGVTARPVPSPRGGLLKPPMVRAGVLPPGALRPFSSSGRRCPAQSSVLMTSTAYGGFFGAPVRTAHSPSPLPSPVAVPLASGRPKEAGVPSVGLRDALVQSLRQEFHTLGARLVQEVREELRLGLPKPEHCNPESKQASQLQRSAAASPRLPSFLPPRSSRNSTKCGVEDDMVVVDVEDGMPHVDPARAKVLIGHQVSANTNRVVELRNMNSVPRSSCRVTVVGQDVLAKSPQKAAMINEDGPPVEVRTGCQRWTRWFVTHPWFDVTICTALSLNVLSICTQVDYMRAHPTGVVSPYYNVLEIVFTSVFVVEFALRAVVFGRGLFTLPGRAWNCVDFVVMLTMVIDLIFTSAVGTDHPSSAETTPLKNMLSVVRFMRLFRVFRAIRVFKFVRELNKMVYLIIGSLESFFWTTLLLGVMTFLFSIVITELVADTVVEAVAVDAELEFKELDEYFFSIAITSMTLWEAISGGVDWKDALDPLTRNINTMLAIPFAMYIGFAVLVMLNLVTGVFVEGAQKLTADDKRRRMLRIVRNLFQDMSDTNQDEQGGIEILVTLSDFEQRYGNPLMKELFNEMDLTLGDVSCESLFNIIDTAGRGSLNVEEIVNGIARLQGPVKVIDLASLMQRIEDLLALMSDQGQMKFDGDLGSFVDDVLV